MASKETINLEIKLNTAIERKLGKLARLTGKLDLDVKSVNLGIQKLNFALQTTSTLLGELSMALGQVAARSQMAFNTRGLSSYNNLLRTAAINSRRIGIGGNLRTIPMQLMSSGVYSRAAGPINVQGGGRGGPDLTDALLLRSMSRGKEPRNIPKTKERFIYDEDKRMFNTQALLRKAGMNKDTFLAGLGREGWNNAARQNLRKRGFASPKKGQIFTEEARLARMFWNNHNNVHPGAYSTLKEELPGLRYGRSRGKVVGNLFGKGARFRYAEGSSILGSVFHRGLLSNPYVLGAAAVGAIGAKAIHEAGRKEFRTQQLKNIFGKDQGTFLMQGITNFANRTPFLNSFLVDQAQQLGAVGFGRQSAIRKLKTIGEFSYGDANRFKSITSAYTKTVSKGKLDAEARNQFLETGKIDPLQIIAKSTETLLDPETGKAIEKYSERLKEVTRMFHAGEVSASLLINAMDGVAGTMTGLKDASQTLEGQLSTAQGQFNEAMAELGSSVLPIAISALKDLNSLLGGMLGSENQKEFRTALKMRGTSEEDLRKFINNPLIRQDVKEKKIKDLFKSFDFKENDFWEDLAKNSKFLKEYEKKKGLDKGPLLLGGNWQDIQTFDPKGAEAIMAKSVMGYYTKDVDSITADTTSKNKLNDLEKGITSGGARQKYITINIDTVKSADNITIDGNDTVDVVEDKTVMAMFKAFGYAGEIATA